MRWDIPEAGSHFDPTQEEEARRLVAAAPAVRSGVFLELHPYWVSLIARR